MFGAAGLLWSGWWESLMGRIKQDTPEVASRLETSLENVNKAAAVSNTENVPWRAILRNTPVRALSYVHFCNNWWANPFEFRFACWHIGRQYWAPARHVLWFRLRLACEVLAVVGLGKCQSMLAGLRTR